MISPNGPQKTPITGVHSWNLSFGAAITVVLGFLVRVYLFARNPIINPDGILYIQQAKALYFGLFDQVLNCYYYLSPYPLLVAFWYRFLGDWVIAAQWVNIIFSTLTIIPLFWLLKRFFPDSNAWITAMVYALLPAYALAGTWVIRDPVFWFFAVTGLYFFILHMEKRSFLWLMLSSICFAAGAWFRMEGSLFILVSSLFLLYSGKKHLWKDLAVFMAPYVIAATAGILLVHFRDIDLMELLKPERLLSRPLDFFTQYSTLRAQLKTLYDNDLVNSAPFFFQRVRNLIWLIALGTLLVQLAETLFYLFFILLAVGMVTWTKRLKTDPRVVSLGTLSILSLALLYSQIIYNWAMTSRFLAVFLFPAFIFIGAGIERMATFLSSRFHLRGNHVYAIIVVIILSLLLPKILRTNSDEDKLVYREIGAYIAGREDNSRVISICGGFKQVKTIHFFANVNFPGAPCFENGAILKRTDPNGLKIMLKHRCNYWVCYQKNCKENAIETLSADTGKQLNQLGEWPSERLGKIILYEVVQ